MRELPKAMLSMPIAFIPDREVFNLVAVQGLQQDSNFYLNANGQWLGKYIPVKYRTYPFMLVPNEADKSQLVLCIDGDSGLVSEGEADELFFDAAGELSDTLAKLMDYLTNINGNQPAAVKICEVLQKHGLFKPWELEIQLEAGIQRVDGLYCIDESVLNALSGDAFDEVRKSGALPVIYCQLLSMQHISALTQIAQSRANPATQSAIDELNFDSISSDGNISFDNL